MRVIAKFHSIRIASSELSVAISAFFLSFSLSHPLCKIHIQLQLLSQSLKLFAPERERERMRYCANMLSNYYTFSWHPKAMCIDYVVCHKNIAFLFVLLHIFLWLFAWIISLSSFLFSHIFSFSTELIFILNNKSWTRVRNEWMASEPLCASLRRIRLDKMRWFIHFRMNLEGLSCAKYTQTQTNDWLNWLRRLFRKKEKAHRMTDGSLMIVSHDIISEK